MSSSSGLEIAFCAASMARFSPDADDAPIKAKPISAITVRTVGEVEIDQTGRDNEIGNSAHRLEQHVVGLVKRFQHRRGLGRDAQQALVGNDDQGIDARFQFFDAFFGLAAYASCLQK
jgi:hypothetical protein